MSEIKPKRKFTRKQIIVWVFILLLIIVAIYFFTYYFAKKKDQVIYQDATRRIYLTDRKGYAARPDREMLRMVYEDMKTGARTFVTCNAPKGCPAKKVAQVILNTVDQGKKSSFDSVQRIGITLVPAKSDIHSNLVEKKSIMDVLPEISTETQFLEINL